MSGRSDFINLRCDGGTSPSFAWVDSGSVPPVEALVAAMATVTHTTMLMKPPGAPFGGNLALPHTSGCTSEASSMSPMCVTAENDHVAK